MSDCLSRWSRPLFILLITLFICLTLFWLTVPAISRPTPADDPLPNWTYACSAQVVAMIGTGMVQQNPHTQTIPASSWSFVQVGGAGFRKRMPTQATVTFSDGTALSLTPPTRLIDQEPAISSGMAGYTFETTGMPGPVTVALDDPDETGEALVIYALRPLTTTHTSGAISTTLQYAWGGDDGRGAVGPAKLTLTLPSPLPVVMDMQVQVAVMDKNPQQGSDQRIAHVRAEAGDATATTTLTNPDENLINIVTMTVPNVAAGTQTIHITLDSPQTPTGESQWNNPNAGDSVFLLGAAAWHTCEPPTPSPTVTPTPPLPLETRTGTPSATTTASPTITATPALSATHVVQVSAGGFHTCVRYATGRVQCWGRDENGQATPPDDRFVHIDTGAEHSCGYTVADQIRCWGSNADGQRTVPAEAMTTVSAGGNNSCSLRADALPICWGTPLDQNVSLTADTHHAQMSVGGSHVCALRAGGHIACWGDNSDGQISVPAGNFIQVSAGGQHTCGLHTDGRVSCWGIATEGQTAVPADLRFTQVSAGDAHTCGVTTAQQVVCWGADTAGQARPPAGSFVAVSAGGRHTCGITTANRVVCWGANEYGQSHLAVDEGLVSIPFVALAQPTPKTFTTLGIHLGNRPAIAWNALPDTEDTFDFLKRLDGSYRDSSGTYGVSPAVIVVLSNQVFNIERHTDGTCAINGMHPTSPVREHVFAYLKKASQWTTPAGQPIRILIRIVPSPGNFKDAVEDTGLHEPIFNSDTPQKRTYCAGQGRDGKNGFESFRSPADIVHEMNAIMEFLTTHETADGFNTNNVFFIPANEPNLEWYAIWHNPASEPISLEDERVWKHMNDYFMNIYVQPHKRSDVRILTPAMAAGLYAETKNLGCQDVLIGDKEIPGYTYMRAVYESGNNGYAWNNYWSEGKETWGDGDACPEENVEPLNHHIFQYFPDWLQTKIRTSSAPAFITEGDLHSPHQNNNTNPIKSKDANPTRTYNSFETFVQEETGPTAGTGGADFLAVWLLTEDKLEEPKYTCCTALNETIPNSREIQWHMAYLVDGTECQWFTLLWK